LFTFLTHIDTSIEATMIACKLFTHIDMITEATKNCLQIIYKDVRIEKHLFLIYTNENI